MVSKFGLNPRRRPFYSKMAAILDDVTGPQKRHTS